VTAEICSCAFFRRPVDPSSAKRDRAIQQAAIHMIRRLDNRRWAAPIRDAPHATRRASVAEVQRKNGSHPAASEEFSFSLPETSAAFAA